MRTSPKLESYLTLEPLERLFPPEFRRSVLAVQLIRGAFASGVIASGSAAVPVAITQGITHVASSDSTCLAEALPSELNFYEEVLSLASANANINLHQPSPTLTIEEMGVLLPNDADFFTSDAH